jgi:hypothetical protein
MDALRSNAQTDGRAAPGRETASCRTNEVFSTRNSHENQMHTDHSRLGFAVLLRSLEPGYTVFAINHRAAPRFRYPAQVEDAQRAVRFIRYHAKRYGIDPARIRSCCCTATQTKSCRSTNRKFSKKQPEANDSDYV